MVRRDVRKARVEERRMRARGYSTEREREREREREGGGSSDWHRFRTSFMRRVRGQGEVARVLYQYESRWHALCTP